LNIVIEHPVLVLVSLKEGECRFRVKVFMLDDGIGEDLSSGLHEGIHKFGSLESVMAYIQKGGGLDGGCGLYREYAPLQE
jgi:hypothetical protein